MPVPLVLQPERLVGDDIEALINRISSSREANEVHKGSIRSRAADQP